MLLCRYANRHIKTERLLGSIIIPVRGTNPLQCGLSEAGLAALWTARAALPEPLCQPQAFAQLLSALLCTSWRKGEQKVGSCVCGEAVGV